ncbi:MAG: WbqC family protein [Bacteroidales bacterium]
MSKMNKILLSTSWFPPLEYFVYLMKAQFVVIDEYETYPKQTWRNRCTVFTGNGLADLTVPVSKPHGNRTQTRSVEISDHTRWQKNHWACITSAYGNAPFFLYYSDLVADCFLHSHPQHLPALNKSVLHSLLREMGVKIKPVYSDHFVRNTGEYFDLRFAISPKTKDRKHLPELRFPPYYQVFSDRFGFQENLSIIDLLFNLGPDASDYLYQIADTIDA